MFLVLERTRPCIRVFVCPCIRVIMRRVILMVVLLCVRVSYDSVIHMKINASFLLIVVCGDRVFVVFCRNILLR